VDALRAAGIPVWVTYPRTVAEGLAMIRELGEVTGVRDRARALLDTLEPLYAAARGRAARRAPVSVFYPIWRQPWMTIGADTYVHDLLATCGGANVFADLARYPTITLDDMAARGPEVILLPDEAVPLPARASARLRRLCRRARRARRPHPPGGRQTLLLARPPARRSPH